MKFTNTITVDRPPAAVFAYLANLENLPRWNYALGETRQLTPGPPGVGTRYVQTRTIPVHTEESLEITELVSDQKLTISGTLNSLPAVFTYTLDAVPGGTTLTNTVDLQPPGPLKLLAPIATSRIKSAVAANLAVLKQLLEQS
ncbi:SRPBCC family protein [Kribbella sp. NPDC000426]|uniref:SRPBCC family protein n=1 Tax=Kribbella sp. NPDC000426 TaxID=3154255 RepID=UPI0033236EE9